tara:strand:+ start:1715 stop:2194 length:480 start_codon:yes stop_codon:yes gene_type:complete
MATLSVGIKEDLVVGGTTHAFDKTGDSANFDITGVNAIYRQTIVVPTTSGGIQYLKFGSAASAGTLIASDFKYMRISNNNSNGGNFVTVTLQDSTANHCVNFKLLANSSIYFTTLVFDTKDSSITAGTSGVTTMRATADELRMQADTGTANVEIFVAHA